MRLSPPVRRWTSTPAGVNEECFAARVVALAEDDLPGIERSGGDGTDATAHWMIPSRGPG